MEQFWIFSGSFIKVLVLLLSINFSQTVDLLEECNSFHDSHVTRGSYTCCSASPRQIPLHLPFDFRSVWKRCAVEAPSPNEDPVVSAWRVYRCILFSGLRGRPLRPSTFANLFTARYPDIIRSKIFTKMAELEDEDAKFEIDVECLKRTPYPKVTLIRNLFYDIEQEICEGGREDDRKIEYSPNIATTMQEYRNNKSSVTLFDIFKKSSTYSTTDFADVLCETCDRRQERYHRNGDCCSHVPIPFPFIYLPYRYGNHEKVKQCSEDLVDDVGLPSDTEFSRHLQHLCYSSCEHYLSGTISESDLWTGINALQNERELRALAIKIVPKYFSRKYKKEVLEYIMENFVSAWLETKTFESEMQLSQRDTRSVDKEKLKSLLISCKSHKLIETTANLYLNTICYEIYPESDYEKSGIFTPSRSTSSNNFTNNFPSALPPKENKDVIIDLDWNQNKQEQQANPNSNPSSIFEEIDNLLPRGFQNISRRGMRPSVYRYERI